MDQDCQNSQNRDTEHVDRDREFTTYRTAQSSNDMVPTVFRRGIYRTIRGSLKRFLSIVVITALGVSVMCGLKAGCEDLCDSVDAYLTSRMSMTSTYSRPMVSPATILRPSKRSTALRRLRASIPRLLTPPWARRASA